MSKEELENLRNSLHSILARNADQLSEHFDTVQIFATKYEPGDDGFALSITEARGSWFARYGQVREWVVKIEERSRLDVHEETAE